MSDAAAKVRSPSQTKRFVKNSSWMVIAQLFRSVEAIVRSVIIARTLGAVGYAEYAVIVAFVSTTQEFFNLNLGAAVIKYGTEYMADDERSCQIPSLIASSYWVTITAAIGSVAVVSIFVSACYGYFFDAPNLHWYITVSYTHLTLPTKA